jgi:hypothetical protein
MTYRKVPNLEKEMKDYDLCPCTRKCNPNQYEVENYCVINYQNCGKYIQREATEWKNWLRKVRKRW